MKSKSRTRHVRRDRRKAKASDFAREGKVKWGKVGHGAGTASVGTEIIQREKPTYKPVPQKPIKHKPATVRLADLWPK